MGPHVSYCLDKSVCKVQENYQTAFLCLYQSVIILCTYPYSYIGRKRLHIDEEYKLDGLETLITPKYSYWTLCYMISLSGAKKLLAQNPLQKILPVDEYFPIMFNEHPM